MPYCQFDGQLTKQEREAILRDFEGTSSPVDGGFTEEVSTEAMMEEEDVGRKRKSAGLVSALVKKQKTTVSEKQKAQPPSEQRKAESPSEQHNTTPSNQHKSTPSKYPKIMLVSLKTGGVGLNLTSANVVFMCDPWWNEAVENQAINRVFRIGQSRKVIVYRLIVENSIEEKILKLQEKKEQLIQSTLDFHSTTTIKLTVDEIANLLR